MEQLPEQPGAGAPSSDDRNLAVIMHVATLATVLTGGWGLNLLVPGAVWWWKRQDVPFVAEHSREQFNFQLSLLIYVFVASVVVLLTIGLALLILIPLGLVFALVVLWVMVRATLAASRGEAYRFPFTMRLLS